MSETDADRRRLLAGLAASTVLSACAAPVRPPPVLVSLAGPEAQDEASLAAGHDLAARMTAPVYLNGEGPFAFVVDTGANHSVLALEVAEPLGLPSGRRAEIHGIAGVEPADTAIVHTLTVGQITVRRVRTPLLSRQRLGADGLLGVDVLKNRSVTLDFQANRFEVGIARPYALTHSADVGRLREALPIDPSVVVVPARYRFGQLIIIDADVGGLPVTAFLDSGSQNTVGNMALSRALAARAERDPQRTIVSLISATGQTASGELSRIPPLRLGGLRIGGMSAVFSDLHIFKLWDLLDAPAILVGVDVMRHFRSIQLDFAHRLVTFRTPSRNLDAGRGVEVR